MASANNSQEGASTVDFSTQELTQRTGARQGRIEIKSYSKRDARSGERELEGLSHKENVRRAPVGGIGGRNGGVYSTVKY